MKKQMIVRENKPGFGLDVGWRVFDREGFSDEVWWGNTRDAETLKLAIKDAERLGYDFDLDESVVRLLTNSVV